MKLVLMINSKSLGVGELVLTVQASYIISQNESVVLDLMLKQIINIDSGVNQISV